MNKYGFGIITGGGPAKPGEVASFKNAAVIRLEITKGEVKASLVVSGIIDPTENKAKYTYFVRPDEIGKSGAAYTEIPFKDDTKKNEFHDVGEDTYVFYLVRHGQAQHNVLTGFINKATSYKDTSLTPSGITQASTSGTKLSEIIKENSEYPDFLFASDLQRTRQTMLNLIKLFTLDNKKIIILPCAHELAYNYDPTSKSCDAEQGLTPNENISKSANCKTPGSKNQTNDDDWGTYCDFYGNATRGDLIKNPGRQRCRDTDMITQAINIIKKSYETSRKAILERPTDLEFGGRRHKSRKVKARHAKKTRHTRKHLTKKKIHSNKRKGRKTRNKNKK